METIERSPLSVHSTSDHIIHRDSQSMRASAVLYVRQSHGVTVGTEALIVLAALFLAERSHFGNLGETLEHCILCHPRHTL